MTKNLTNITKPIQEVVETVESPIPQPTIPEEGASSLPKVKRAGFKAMNYDYEKGGMTNESGRFVRR